MFIHIKRDLLISFCMSFFILWLNVHTTSSEKTANDCDEITEENVDDCIRLNQIQVLGTHNSYKLAPTEKLAKLMNAESPGRAIGILYEHRPLIEQFSELQIRQIELDIFADPDGGLFAEPLGAIKSDDQRFIRPNEMYQPGYKVLHVQDTDYRSTCLTLQSCLLEVRQWSLNNPDHLPLAILIEVKDNTPDDRGDFTFQEAVRVDEWNIFDIDDEIWSVFEPGHVITPDDVRGNHTTLEEAILADGWPTLAESRGRILFMLDNEGSHRDAYLSRSEILENRVMFTSSEPGEPSAGFIKMNNALEGYELIHERVQAGYLIRTRSDIPAQEAISGDTTRRENALNSGAQYISTDYPEPSPFGTGYIVALPGAEGPARCNPVSAPPGCENHLITE
ncbi:MAG: phosphatidylinositol-specific phospholipase C1-like protein [Balneolaceae bacterium]|nr:phosphatidylinositol-specific phospholipase C1-like protein [Balneolaceae bacterium]